MPKYGRIERRLKYSIGTYEHNNKKEILYEEFIKKMKYDRKEVLIALKESGMDYRLEIVEEKNVVGRKNSNSPMKQK